MTSLIGPLAPVIIPAVAQPSAIHQSDYEAEFTVVIGRAAKNVTEAEALDYVLGYTGGNDVGPEFSLKCHIFHRLLSRCLFVSINLRSLNGVSPKVLVSLVFSRPKCVLTSMVYNLTDDTNPFGPCLVAASSIPDPQTVAIKFTLNGKIVQDGTTA